MHRAKCRPLNRRSLSWQIKELQDEANRLGEEGEVDESMKKMTEVEALKRKKDGLENPHFPGTETPVWLGPRAWMNVQAADC